MGTFYWRDMMELLSRPQCHMKFRPDMLQKQGSRIPQVQNFFLSHSGEGNKQNHFLVLASAVARTTDTQTSTPSTCCVANKCCCRKDSQNLLCQSHCDSTQKVFKIEIHFWVEKNNYFWVFFFYIFHTTIMSLIRSVIDDTMANHEH